MKQRLLLGIVLILSALPLFAEEAEVRTSAGLTRVAAQPAAPVLLLNSPRCRVNYDVKNVGPSGICQVETYLTRDEGRTWSLYGTCDTHEVRETAPEGPRSITVDLLREGVYGLYLLPKSGVGLGKQPPQSGTRPQTVVEVDLTAPTLELYALKPHPDRRDSVTLTWKASDRNLGGRSIGLEWAATKSGRWQKIADDIENSGSYVWKMSPNLPARVHLRVTAKDRAGNVATAETPEAVCLDAAEPEAIITGVEAAGAK
jgi:hypothetical protein